MFYGDSGPHNILTIGTLIHSHLGHWMLDTQPRGPCTHLLYIDTVIGFTTYTIKCVYWYQNLAHSVANKIWRLHILYGRYVHLDCDEFNELSHSSWLVFRWTKPKLAALICGSSHITLQWSFLTLAFLDPMYDGPWESRNCKAWL